jgi:CheY-like chemotaxis protein
MLPILVVAPVASRRRIVDILRRAGYFVSEADGGESAMKMACSIFPRLVLMSIVMPEGNGLEIAANLRRIPDFCSLPIILLVSVTPIGINDEPLVSLVNGYLDIDVPAKDLLATVSRQLSLNNQL